MTRAGFVGIVGRPNSGKSTLINALVGEKLLLVSHKANATRKRFTAIAMHGNAQIIFVDTPGLHEKEKLLNKFMQEEALRALGDADLLVFLADAKDKLTNYEAFLALNQKNIPHIVALNKIDELQRTEVGKKIEEYSQFQESFLALVPLSAKSGSGLPQLMDEIAKHLPEGPYLYDSEQLSAQSVREIYKELIREAVFDGLSDELPYECDVIIEKIEEMPKLDRVFATIVVNKDAQKAMVIGQGGATVKRLGTAARKSLERFSGKKIYLELFVKTVKNWVTDKDGLKQMGYEFSEV